jgi:hypothetical protein
MVGARIVREDPNPVQVYAKASTAIEPGDMLWLNNDGYAEPASTFPWTTNLATTQANFHPKFLGISMDKRLASQTTPGLINVATRGRYRVPCSTDTNARNVGTLYGPGKASGNALESRVCAVVTGANLAVGVLAKPKAADDTVVEIEVVSSILHRGVQNIVTS